MGGPWHAGRQRKKRRKDILNTNKWQTKLIAVIADAAFLRRRSAGQQHCLRNPDYTEWEKPHTFGMWIMRNWKHYNIGFEPCGHETYRRPTEFKKRDFTLHYIRIFFLRDSPRFLSWPRYKCILTNMLHIGLWSLIDACPMKTYSWRIEQWLYLGWANKKNIIELVLKLKQVGKHIVQEWMDQNVLEHLFLCWFRA